MVEVLTLLIPEAVTVEVLKLQIPEAVIRKVQLVMIPQRAAVQAQALNPVILDLLQTADTVQALTLQPLHTLQVHLDIQAGILSQLTHL